MLWLNGTLIPTGIARIDPSDRGLTLGDGLFETLRAVDGVPNFASLHLARLRQGAAQLNIHILVDDTAITAAFSDTLAANRLRDAVLRLTVTRGIGPRGVAPSAKAVPTLMITGTAFAPPAVECSAIICRGTRRNEFSPLARIKSLNYLDNIIARLEAAQRDADEAILLNTQGDVAEASAANLFLLKDGKWRTPFVADGALPGILRGRALASGIAFESRITEPEMFAADAVCFGNVLGVRSVSTIDGRPIAFRAEAAAGLRSLLPGEPICRL